MKSKNILISLLILVCFQTNGQEIDEDQDKDELLTRSLSYFSTSNSFSSIGNFVALNTEKNTLNASLSFLTSEKSMYTINIKAGATQGIASVFDEGKLNKNASIGLEHRWLFSSKTDSYAGYNIPDQRLIALERQKIEDDFNAKKLEMLQKLSTHKIDTTESRILGDYKTPSGKDIDLKAHGELLKKVIKIDSVLKMYDDMNLKTFDKLDNRTKKLVTDIQNHRKELLKRTEIGSDTVYGEAMLQLISTRNKKKAELKKKQNALKPRFVRLNFMSFGYRADNNNFVRFLDSLAPADQLKKTDYTSHNFSLSYNFISNMKDVESNSNKQIIDFDASTYRFFTIGAEYSYSSNLSSLEEVEVIDNRFTSTDDTRVVNKNQNAFFGDYKEDLSAVTAFVDYYSFFDKNKINFTAFHINPTMIFKENQKPVANVQLGLLIPFKKKDDEKTTVNIEIFYRVKDVFNTADSATSLLNRNTIGIQTAFPFNIK